MDSLLLFLVFLFDLGLIIYILSKRKVFFQFKESIIIISYCFLNSLINLLSLSSHINTNSFYRVSSTIFTIVEFLLFSSFFFFCTEKSTTRKVIATVGLLFTVVVVLWNLIKESSSFDSLSIGIGTILLFLYSFNYLYEELKSPSLEFLYVKGQFWILVGILIYLGGSFFIYIFTEHAIANGSEMSGLKEIWFLTYVFYIVKSVFFVIGLRLFSKTKNERKQELMPSFH